MTKKIFIVDQSELIKHNLTQQLKSSFEVRTASYADTALLNIIDWEPDIIVSGVEIGNITGFDLCVLLKMIPKYASKPFIILSSQTPSGISEKAKEVGADLYLEKKQEVLATIKKKIITLLPDGNELNRDIGKVLLVDDSPIIRLMMINMLSGIGIKQIEQANHGLEALKLLDQIHFDLLITDYHMPEMNGPQLIQEIRKTRSAKSLPIILATGVEDSKVGKEFSNIDIQAKLTKPISVNDLRITLATI